MRKYFFVLGTCLLLWNLQSIAQSVAINNDASLPTLGSMLDIKSSSKGLLIPRIGLTGTDDILTVPVRPEALLIYNTTTTGGSNAVTPGFYYWSGASWVRLTNNSSGLMSGWLLGGNNGTSPTTHFIGTTDNNPLQFKVNNLKAGYLGNDNNDGSVFWGYASGYQNTTGSSNVAIGIRALFSNTGISNLVAVGDSALYNNSSGTGNTAVGSKSLFANAGGFGNTAIGSLALYQNTSGGHNTATGFMALNQNTIGVNNTAIGTSTLQSNTSGSTNTAIGYAALLLNTIGFENTAVGTGTLSQNTTGADNTSMGFQALNGNTTGNENAAFGLWALTANTNGFANTSIGSYSLLTNSTGSENTATGYNALYSNTVGVNNTAHGGESLQSNQSGNNNTASGFRALRSTVGTNNTGIGYNAISANTSGNSNTALGADANVSAGSLNNATAIGANSRADCSNCLVLGSVNGVNGATSNVNVGIGVNNPQIPLSFGSAPGDKIAFRGNASNSIGFGIQPGLLQIHTDAGVADIVFGFGSSASMSETMRIKGNGTLEAQKIKVGNGTLFSKQQAGTATVGPNGSNFMTYTLTFPAAFSTVPKVTANAKNDPAFSNVNDTFCITIRNVSPTSVTFNILRVDANAPWLQNLLLDWMAWE